MAVHLKTPSDFAAKSTNRQQEPLKLLPPSEFEKPRSAPGTTWTELKKAAEEIQALKQENQKLKDKITGSILSDSAASQPVSAAVHPLPMDERRYADELISRQAEELSKLRLQVQQLEHDQQAMRDDCQRQLAEVEREREQTVAALSDSLQRREEENEQQVTRLCHQHEGEVADLKSQLLHLATDLEHSKGDLTSQVADLTDKLRCATLQAREQQQTLQQELSNKEVELRNQTQQVQQLRTYITESEQQHRPQQVWVQQCETLSNKLQVAEAEKERLDSSVQLMEVRLSAMKEILHTQETELSKGKESTVDKNKLKELQLTRWRQKVYALLVQQKSAQIDSRKDLHNWQQKTEILEEKLSSANNSINVLQHTVADRDADLQLAASNNRKLQEQVTMLEQVCQSVDSEHSRDGQVVQHLAEAACRCEEKVQQQVCVMQQALAQLKSLGQRVSFASSRMDVLKSQLARKTALQQLEEQEQARDPVSSDTEEGWRTEKEHLREELSRLASERDMLASQLQHDSQTWTDKVSSMRSQYDAEVHTLKRTVEDLELSNQEKSKVVDQLQEELSGCQTELAESRERVEHLATVVDQLQEELSGCQTELAETRERVEHLATELGRHHHTMQQGLDAQRQKLEEQYTEQLADMERQLNDARREHTKAVVAFRQQERQWGRERERSEEVQSATEAHYAAEVEHLRHNLLAVERERNLFMATLRQEGLLGRLRSERGEPMKLELQEEVAMESQESQSATEVTETDSLQAVQESSEAVSAVLEDLKSLVPAVLEDTVDSSDENQD